MSDVFTPDYLPAATFERERIFLVPDDNPYKAVILWTDYNFQRQEVRLHITGPNASSMREFGEYAAAEQELLNIAEQYPGMVVTEALLSDWRKFFALEGLVGMVADVQHVSNWCWNCDNYSTNSFSFLYCPVIPGAKLQEPSLYLHWEFGCDGGRKIAGSFDEVADEMESMLTEMLQNAGDSCKDDLQKALLTVTSQRSMV